VVGSKAGYRVPRIYPISTAAKTPAISARMALPRSMASPRMSPSEMPKIGVIKGATSMAPITTAVLLVIRPKLAIMVETATRA